MHLRLILAASILVMAAASLSVAQPDEFDGPIPPPLTPTEAPPASALDAQPVVVDVTPPQHMTIWQAAVLGVVEGATEYLPVSSTGHLILTQRAMGIADESPDLTVEQEQQAKDAANAFAICIQGGAIAAVLGLYWRKVRQMIVGAFALAGVIGLRITGKRERADALWNAHAVGIRMGINLVVGVLPAVVLGLAFEKTIKTHLFGLWWIVAAWAVGGVLILAVGWWRRQTRGADEAHEQGEHAGLALEELTWPRALLIGLLQCVAMWPGVSRSLMTICGGVIAGLRLPAAVEFSFLLGVVTLGGATVKDGVSYGPLMLDLYGPMPLIVGCVAAFVSAVLAIEWMVGYLKRRPLDVFGWYRIALALVVAVLLWRGVIEAT